jgi:hypothetical protein
MGQIINMHRVNLHLIISLDVRKLTYGVITLGIKCMAVASPQAVHQPGGIEGGEVAAPADADDPLKLELVK